MKVCRLTIKVKPNSRVEAVEKLSNEEFSVKVKPEAKEGRANQAALELLSDYFDIPKSRISILKGSRSRTKRVEIIIS